MKDSLENTPSPWCKFYIIISIQHFFYRFIYSLYTSITWKFDSHCVGWIISSTQQELCLPIICLLNRLMMSSKWPDDLIDSKGSKILGSRNAAVLAKIIATLMDSACMEGCSIDNSSSHFTRTKFESGFLAVWVNWQEALPWFRVITKIISEVWCLAPAFLHRNEVEAYHQFLYSIFLQDAKWIRQLLL